MNRWLITVTVMLPTLIEIIDTSVVNVSLDHIRGTFSAGIEESTWTITSYLVSNAIIIPITGWLSRLMGRKNYLLLSIGVFTGSSFLCGSSWSIESLIFFRIIQGLGGGALQPLSQSILLETFPPSQHGMAMAAFGMGIMFGPIIGPLMGGWITDNWTWRWIFYINVPIGVLSILMTLMFIHDPPYMRRMRMRIDYLGLGLLAVGLGSLQFVLDKGQMEDWFASSIIVTFSIIAVVALALLVIVESYSEQPVVNLRLFKDRTYTVGTMVMFFAFFNLFGTIILLPIFLQTLMGYTAFLAGLVLGPAGIATMAALPMAGWLVTRVNPKGVLVWGILVSSLSVYLMSRFNLQTDFWNFVWPRAVLGAGMGFLFIPLTTMTLSHVPKEHMTDATGIYNLLRNIGGSVGVAFVTTVLSRRAQFHHFRLSEHMNPFNPEFYMAKERLAELLSLKGLDGGNAELLIYTELQRQAHMLSFNDVFYMLCIMMLFISPLALMMRRPKRTPTPLAVG
jgi:DHA2 family multidrug resistance protein